MKISNRWIIVNDYETKCKLGIYPKELNRAQRVTISVRLEVSPKIHNDNINKVLSYEKIIDIINDITTDNHKYLAETVSEEIAKKCLKLKNTISAHVILKKPDIIKGKTIVGVETFLKNNKQKY